VLYSLSKSFTSTAVGLAIAEGKLSLNDPVLKFFPGEGPSDPSGNLRAMRVRDLLRMSSGQTEDAIKDFNSQAKEDRVRAFLSIPVAYKPGTHFVYNSPGTFMLSAIVQKVTGETVLEYLRPRPPRGWRRRHRCRPRTVAIPRATGTRGTATSSGAAGTDSTAATARLGNCAL
jgi:CubicO group peptidase (beta-lactamase class C family)